MFRSSTPTKNDSSGDADENSAGDILENKTELGFVDANSIQPTFLGTKSELSSNNVVCDVPSTSETVERL